MKKPIKHTDPLYPNLEQPEPVLEPGCFENGKGGLDTALSVAISAKRQADALERIAGILEKQTGIAELLSDELRG